MRPRLDAEKKMAELVVDVTHLGQRAVIDKIKVVGARRNSVNAVLDYLGLRTPLPFSIDLIPKIESRLRASARFWDYSASFQQTDPTSNRLTLHIMIDEYKPAPPLSRPLSAVEAALLKNCPIGGFASRRICG